MAENQIVCPVCGAKNAHTDERCAACGARIDKIEADYTAEELQARRYQQDSFVWKWVFVSFAIYGVLQLITLVVLPLVLTTYDPQGLPGLVISASVWFLGGILVGLISPGKTFFEPAIGALFAVFPTVAWLMIIDDVAQLSLMAYIIFGLLGVMVTLMGAFIGERIQMAGSKS